MVTFWLTGSIGSWVLPCMHTTVTPAHSPTCRHQFHANTVFLCIYIPHEFTMFPCDFVSEVFAVMCRAVFYLRMLDFLSEATRLGHMIYDPLIGVLILLIRWKKLLVVDLRRHLDLCGPVVRRFMIRLISTRRAINPFGLARQHYSSLQRPYIFHTAANFAGKPPWKDTPTPKDAFLPNNPVALWRDKTIRRHSSPPRSAGEDFFLCSNASVPISSVGISYNFLSRCDTIR